MIMRSIKNLKSAFITFEGVEGSGKSTIINKLYNDLRDRGPDYDIICNAVKYRVTKYSDPGTTNLGKQLKSVIMDNTNDISSIGEAFLFAAARSQLVKDCIGPDLYFGDNENAKLVLCDRYIDSNLVYQTQGNPKLIDKDIRNINDLATKYYFNSPSGAQYYFSCIPDLTLILDVDPEITLRRQFENGCERNSFDMRSLDFHRRIREAYLNLAKTNTNTYKVIDASRSLTDVYVDVLNAIQSKVREVSLNRNSDDTGTNLNSDWSNSKSNFIFPI